MDRKKASLITAVVGIILIILSQVTVSYSTKNNLANENYIKENLKTIAKKCYLDGKCKNGQITIEKLISNSYIDNDLKDKLKGYSKNSFVVYPSLEVVLITE